MREMEWPHECVYNGGLRKFIYYATRFAGPRNQPLALHHQLKLADDFPIFLHRQCIWCERNNKIKFHISV